MSDFAVALGDVCSPFTAFRPPTRVSVSEGAQQNLVIRQPGGYVGPWSAEETPYMLQPMNALASREHEAVCFAGPARTGKTMGLIDGWMAHVIVNDPGDSAIIQMTQDKAREYSRVRMDRMLEFSPRLAALLGGAQSDNTHDKQFKHGMWLRIAWPTISNLSGSDYRYMALTDYDRMPSDINGEGSAYALALKRTQTFMSRGMCMVESSPGFDLEDPNYTQATLHEAPPVGGVLGIYNTSDRHRWYWRCLDCRDWFEATPGLGLFGLPPEVELLETVREVDIAAMAKQYARVVCPCCGSIIDSVHKNTLNQGGRWVGEGQTISGDGVLGGTLMRSTVAGYWLGGVAATYQSWTSLVSRYLQGLRSYALTGDEQPLKVTTNTDQGMPYMSQHLRAAQRSAAQPGDRAEGIERYVVPDDTRVLVATVDVQGGSNASFVVQVHAVTDDMEQTLVDRYSITKSARAGMGDEPAPIDPAAYAEDWDILTSKVVLATYRTSRDGVELKVKLTVVDSGGEDGVTDRAYAWWRRLRDQGLHSQVMLVKGAPSKNAPMIRETWVGAKGTKSSKGDVPLYLLNTNLFKDAVTTGLKRPTPGPGYIHFPDWLPKAFFDELQAEVRLPSGVWQQIRKRNEAFDLCCYVRAGLLRLGFDKIKDWRNAPTWAATVWENPLLVTREERREIRIARPQRRSAPSPYLV